MDNRTLDITSDNIGHLRAALSIVFDEYTKANHLCEFKLAAIEPGEGLAYITAYREDPAGIPTLILSRGPIHDHGQKSLHPLNAEEALTSIMGWLRYVEYGQEPGIDGSCKKGWRAFTESWGHVLGSSQAIIAVQPAWALYGK